MVRCRRGPQHFVRSLQGNQALLFMVALAGSEFSGRSAVWYFEVIHKPEVTILLLKTEKKPKKGKGKALEASVNQDVQSQAASAGTCWQWPVLK